MAKLVKVWNGSAWELLAIGGAEHLFEYSIAGAQTVVADVYRWYNKTGRTLTISKVWLSIGTAPTGSSLIVDVNKNGTTIYTTQANRPAIAASSFVSPLSTNMDVTTIADGDYLSFDIDQIGSTVAGSNLIITVVLVG